MSKPSVARSPGPLLLQKAPRLATAAYNRHRPKWMRYDPTHTLTHILFTLNILSIHNSHHLQQELLS